MSDPNRTIFTNVLPTSNIPSIAIPHPLRKAKVAARVASNALKLKTAKGEFGEAGDNVSFSFRDTPAVRRLRIEVVHPQDAYVYEDGTVVPASNNADELFSGRWNSSYEVVKARGVEVFKGVFSREGFLLGTPKIEHHVQSTFFEGGFIRDQKKGAQAGKSHAADILKGLETHGIEFLESIEDPEIRADAAKAMLSTSDMLGAPGVHFGIGSALPDLSPDAMIRSAEFKAYVSTLLGGRGVKAPSRGIELG